MEPSTSQARAEGQATIEPASSFVGETRTIMEQEVNAKESEGLSDQEESVDNRDGVENKMAAQEECTSSSAEERADCEQRARHLVLGHQSGEDDDEDRTKMAAKTNMVACMEPEGEAGERKGERKGQDFPVQFRVQETNFSKGQLKLTLKTMKEGKAVKNKKLKGVAGGSKTNMKAKKGKVTAKKMMKKVRFLAFMSFLKM